jgi:prepilin-type N-terminal cleavage/methylation domain-containing protein
MRRRQAMQGRATRESATQRPAEPNVFTKRRRSQAGITLTELLVSIVILGILSTMLVGTWISLQRSFAFAQQTNTARASARDALDRVSAELRDAQPPTTTSTTPFYFTLSAPYVCDANDCVFYSAYNNLQAAADGADRNQLRLTAIWLDTSGTTNQKTLYWQRDTNNNGTFDSTDQKIILARNVVNTASGVNRPIFTYVFRDTSNNYTTSNSLTAANVATLVSVNIELVVDSNLKHTPTRIDLISTVRPRNQGSS